MSDWLCYSSLKLSVSSSLSVHSYAHLKKERKSTFFLPNNRFARLFSCGFKGMEVQKKKEKKHELLAFF